MEFSLVVIQVTGNSSPLALSRILTRYLQWRRREKQYTTGSPPNQQCCPIEVSRLRQWMRTETPTSPCSWCLYRFSCRSRAHPSRARPSRRIRLKIRGVCFQRQIARLTRRGQGGALRAEIGQSIPRPSFLLASKSRSLHRYTWRPQSNDLPPTTSVRNQRNCFGS